MKTNTEYKNEALAALKGNWGPAVLGFIVYFLLVVVFIIPYEAKVLTMDMTDLQAAGSLTWWMVLYMGGVILVGGPLLVGLVNAYKKLLFSADNRIASNEIKIGFGNWLHHVWGYLLKAILVFLWALLLFIPGIIKSLSYAMTNYILADNSEVSAYKAISLSKDMMYGHKYDLFYLYLSFAGWFILSLFTLGIGLFWLIPYAQVAQASFYSDVKAEWEARHSAA